MLLTKCCRNREYGTTRNQSKSYRNKKCNDKIEYSYWRIFGESLCGVSPCRKYCYASFMKRFTGHTEEWGTFMDVKDWPEIKNPKNFNFSKFVEKISHIKNIVSVERTNLE